MGVVSAAIGFGIAMAFLGAEVVEESKMDK